VLTDEERAAAQPLDYGETYKRMTDGLLELSRDGIQVFSLLDIFKSERGKIYADQIHFTYTPDGQSRGNRLIAKAMARRMSDTWQMERICDNSAASN